MLQQKGEINLVDRCEEAFQNPHVARRQLVHLSRTTIIPQSEAKAKAQGREIHWREETAVITTDVGRSSGQDPRCRRAATVTV
jgi:hypothetical protein